MFDRSESGENSYVMSATSWFNDEVRPFLGSCSFGPCAPHVAYYYQADEWPNWCPDRVPWNIPGYSFTTVCTSHNLVNNCGLAFANKAGCTLTRFAPGHVAIQEQPATWIKAGLSEPFARRNIIFHEFIHSIGMNHNLSQSNSLMDATSSPNSYDELTLDDLWELYFIYQHSPPE